VLYYMTQYGNIETLVFIRSLVTIKELNFKVGQFLFADTANGAGRDFETGKLGSQFEGDKSFQESALSATDLQDFVPLEPGTQQNDVLTLIQRSQPTPLG